MLGLNFLSGSQFPGEHNGDVKRYDKYYSRDDSMHAMQWKFQKIGMEGIEAMEGGRWQHTMLGMIDMLGTLSCFPGEASGNVKRYWEE